LLGPWVDMVRQACQQPARRSRPPRLDLAAVTYVDPAGALLLRDLVSDGVEIAACSNFVAELLVSRGSLDPVMQGILSHAGTVRLERRTLAALERACDVTPVHGERALGWSRFPGWVTRPYERRSNSCYSASLHSCRKPSRCAVRLSEGAEHGFTPVRLAY